jgi:hypothetical protein
MGLCRLGLENDIFLLINLMNENQKMNITVLNKRTKISNIKNKYPNGIIIDVTSKSSDEFIQFSPFFPHGNIPIPFSPGFFSQSVEGIWQGLKVFENFNIDTSKFEITDMKNIKRTTRKFGKILGHQKGINGDKLLDYIDARINIYIPSYEWVLRTRLTKLLNSIERSLRSKSIIFLDYETNFDLYNISKPLSHASLIKNYLENNYSIKF